MKDKIIGGVVVISLLFSLGLSSTQAQGIGNIAGRLSKLEERLDRLEAIQKKNIKKLGTKLSKVQPGKDESNIASSIPAILARIDGIEESLQQIADDYDQGDQSKIVSGIDSSLSYLGLKIHQLEENVENIKVGGNKSGEETEIITGLASDLRGLIGELRSFVDGNTFAQHSSIRVKYPVDLYGYIKLDACYDDAYTSVGNFARWVESDGNDNSRFNLTVRQTRFGLNFSGTEVGRTRTSGKMEIDFYGGGAENKNLIMLRHAFMKVYWPKTDFSILAGQTSDVFSPLVPSTVNYVVAWWAGNIGYRRPQLRFNKGFKLGENSKLNFELAAARSIGGEAAGFPSLQGRSALSFPLLTDKKTTIGVSGHSGKEETDSYTWSANLDLTLPISNKIALKGEYWQGENLDAYLGGIGQGVKVREDEPDEIASRGGWASLSLGPFNDWGFNIGSSIDDPDDKALEVGDRAQNVSIFGNILYALNQFVNTGLEVSYWDTKYKELEDKNSFRVQWSLIYKF